MQEMQETWIDPWVGKIPWNREWLPTPVFLPGKFHGQKNLVGYIPWGHRIRHNPSEQVHKQIVLLQHGAESSPKAKNLRHGSGSRAPVNEPKKRIERKCGVAGRVKALGPTRWCLMPAPQPLALARPALFPLP